MTHLPRRDTKRALGISLVEAIFWALMVGMGEVYFVANAVRLGATALELGLVVALPLWSGAAGPVLTLAALTRLRRRKPWTVGLAAGQAAALLLIAGLDLAGSLTVSLLILLACCYQVCGMGAGTAWNSWYGDLVPRGIRGRYFARRGRGVQVATCAGLIAAGTLLELIEPGSAAQAAQSGAEGAGGRGYQLIFGLAALARATSALLLAISPEPPFSGLSRPRRVVRFLATARGQSAWRVLLAGAVLQLTTYLASPYFNPFMLEELEFTYVEYMAATISVMLGKFLFFPTWGRAIDRYGARPVFLLVASLVTLVPLPWLWARGLLWVVPAQFFSGASWSGYEVSYFSVLLDSSYRRTRAHVFAAQNVLNGTAQLIGGILGGLLLTASGRHFQLVFGVSVASRLLVSAVLPRLLPRGEQGHPGRRELILRMVGVRPIGGVADRPVIGDEDEEEGAARSRSKLSRSGSHITR